MDVCIIAIIQTSMVDWCKSCVGDRACVWQEEWKIEWQKSITKMIRCEISGIPGARAARVSL